MKHITTVLFGIGIGLFMMPLMAAPLNVAKPTFGAPIFAKIITQPTSTASAQASTASATKQPARQATRMVALMNIPLTAEQKKLLQTFPVESTMASMDMATTTHVVGLPSRVLLGMNNVPVLDQGMHGSCVTFAVTAALDALLNKGDYISQLCSLSLGRYLEQRSYVPSGWEGSFGFFVLGRFSEYGFINKDQQLARSCAGITEYPANDTDNTGNPMSLEEYADSSEDFNDHFYWFSLLMPDMRFAPAWTAKQGDALLATIKTVLATKGAKQSVRPVFAALLPVNHCSVGACATYHHAYDTWALTRDIMRDPDLEFGGHEMVITGYDDQAVAIDNEGKKHRGLLVLRNSWSEEAGDHGDYYMTYDFFKQLTMAVEIVKQYNID